MAIIAFEIVENDGEYAAFQPKAKVTFRTKGGSEFAREVVVVTHLLHFIIKRSMTGWAGLATIEFKFIGLCHIHGLARHVTIKTMLKFDSAFQKHQEM